VREDAASAKREAAQATAKAEYESDRATRLLANLETQREQLDSLMTSNAKYQALLTETEKRLHAAQAQADEAGDAVSYSL